jgi:uncharacterized membrane protein YfcA
MRRMKKIILQIVVPFLAGFGILIALGFPIGQALVTSVCGMIGMYMGSYLSNRKSSKKLKNQ